MNKDRLKIGLPGGELQKNVLTKLQNSGIALEPADPKNYLISASKLPVDFVVVRASSMPEIVSDKRSKLKAGITGSDIIWESGWDKNSGAELPIESKSTLVLSVTDSLRVKMRNRYQREPDILDLEGSMIATKFPNITAEILTGINEIEIFYAPGKTEAQQYIYPCDGLVDVTSTGSALRANNFTVIKKILDPVTVRLIDDGNLSDRDQEILSDVTRRLQK